MCWCYFGIEVFESSSNFFKKLEKLNEEQERKWRVVSSKREVRSARVVYTFNRKERSNEKVVVSVGHALPVGTMSYGSKGHPLVASSFCSLPLPLPQHR